MQTRPWLFAAALALLAAPALAGDVGKPAATDETSALFAQADANKDGKLTLDEFKTFRGLVAQKHADAQFQRIDATHAGTVTLSQIQAFTVANAGMHHKKDAGATTKQ